MHHIDAVLLDVGGVFALPRHATVARIFEEFGVSLDAETHRRAHYAATTAWDRTGEDRAWLEAYVGEISVSPEHFDGSLDALGDRLDLPWDGLVAGSVEGLRAIALTGVTLAIVSNADGQIEGWLRDNAVCQVGPGPGVRVEIVVDSTVVGVSKPDPRIFGIALAATGTDPARSMYVGDMVTFDVVGARTAGLRPLHFDPYELCGDREDHPHVASLHEVAELVRSG